MTGRRHARRLARRRGATAALIAAALIAAACGGDSTGGDDGAGEVPVISADRPPDEQIVSDVASTTDEATANEVTTDAASIADGEIVEDVVVEDPSGEEADPTPGGTMRFAIEADVDGLNPTTSVLSAPGRMMANTVFDTLAAWDADANAVPYLAESIEPVDGDLSRWRVVVRDGIEFHDGTPLTAEAVQVNFNTQLASPLVGLSQRPFFPAEGASTIIDERTIEFSMLDANAVFPAWLTSQLGMVASPDWLAAATENPALNQEPVGTGPFRFESRAQDSITKVVRNDDWWGGDVHLDAVEFLPVLEPADRADLLRGGEVHGVHVTDPAIVGDLVADDAVQNVLDETGEEAYVMLNTAAPPFDDLRARQAFAWSTPLENFRNLIGLGIARGADQMFIPESRFYNPDVIQQGDDVEAAAALAAEYCADVPEECSDGKIDVQFQFPGGTVAATRQAEILAEGWGELFNVEFEELVQDEHIQQVVFGQYEAAIFRGFGAIEPAGNRHVLMCRTIGDGISLNATRFCSEDRDALILDAHAQPDEAIRIADWQAIVQDMNDAFTHIFLLHTTWDNAFDRSVRGVCARTSPEGVALRCASAGVTWFDTVWLAE